ADANNDTTIINGNINSVNNAIQTMTSDIEKVRAKLEQIINIGKCINKRDMFNSAFCKTVYDTIKRRPTLRGDYAIKYAESSTALETLFGDDVFGNPIGTELEFAIDSGFSSFDNVKFMTFMDKLRQTTEKPINERL